MQVRGIPSIFAAINGEARESETTTSGSKLCIDSISALTCFIRVYEARNGPGSTAVCLKSIVPSRLT